jgi:hypothetical protein
LLVVPSIGSASLVNAAIATAGTVTVYSCSAYGDAANDTDVAGQVWGPIGDPAYTETNGCLHGRSFQILADESLALGGTQAQWGTTTPRSLSLTSAYTPPQSVLINPQTTSGRYRARFLWDGGSRAITDASSCCGGLDYATTINQAIQGRYFLIQVYCPNGTSCTWPGNKNELLDVKGIRLTAADSTAPTLSPSGEPNLWSRTTGYVRGTWPVSVQATDDSGVCHMVMNIDGVAAKQQTSTPNQHSWTQCPTPQAVSTTVDTTAYPDGAMSLQVTAKDAATPANQSVHSEAVNIDNQPVTLGLAGPTDALSTAGTQYITATATAGPSGVAGIHCSLDNSPYVQHAGANVRIPVQGIGTHHLSCFAQNDAIDSAGTPAR